MPTPNHETTVNYHKRVDFRALDVMIDAVDSATPDELKHAYDMCMEWSKAPYTKPHKRALWRALARFIRTAREGI